MKKILLLLIVIIITGIIGAGIGYNYFFSNNINSSSPIHIYIPSGSSYSDVLSILKENKVLKNYSSFELLASKMNLTKKVYPGHYLFKPKMNNKDIIRMLRGGLQTPVKVTFNNVRTKADLAGKISRCLEIDSVSFYNMLYDTSFLSKNGLDTNNVLCLFIPNTYEMYWNTSQKKLMERVIKEYKTFWTDERKSKAQAQGLTQMQVSILASIVQAEQLSRPSERPIIAGLYLNRLHKGMLLESDPTLIYATGDFTIKRVLNIHKEIDSPFNTYKNVGLPPGPINLPDISSLNAVLNPNKNEYIFMCAKEDMSGYHNFAVDYNQHLKNAALYTAALNKMKIYK
jgi:UPF0755 protein